MLYRFVWSEPNNVGYNVMLMRALERALKKDKSKFEEFYSWTDEELLTNLANLNGTISETLAKQLILRCQMYEFAGKWTKGKLGDYYERLSTKEELERIEGNIVHELQKKGISNVINDAVILFHEKGLKLEEINTEILKFNGKTEKLRALDKYKDVVNFCEGRKVYGEGIKIYCFQPLVEPVQRIAETLRSKY